jgi:hypothetical protein
MTDIMQEKIKAETLFDITVKGTITDEKGETLAGVNVVQKGTQRGTSTDEKGTFSISISLMPDAILIFLIS